MVKVSDKQTTCMMKNMEKYEATRKVDELNEDSNLMVERLGVLSIATNHINL